MARGGERGAGGEQRGAVWRQLPRSRHGDKMWWRSRAPGLHEALWLRALGIHSSPGAFRLPTRLAKPSTVMPWASWERRAQAALR